jgi:transcriptional regulator GlxA family with amidase domain
MIQKEVALELLEKQPQDFRVRKVILEINAVPHSKIQDLALGMKVSVSRLEHLFKRETGMPLSLYLQKLRLYHSAHLLVESDERIKTIAFTAGYSHCSSFVRAFKLHFGESPQTYRRRIRERDYKREIKASVG